MVLQDWSSLNKNNIEGSLVFCWMASAIHRWCRDQEILESKGWCLDTDMVITWDRHLQHHQCSQDTVPLVTSGVAGTARTGDRSRDKLSERSEETRGDIRSADITEAARGRAMPDGAARVTRVEAAPLMSRAEPGLVWHLSCHHRWPDPSTPRPHQHTEPTKMD